MANDSTITANRELALSRTINAPRELVWEVWTNPDHIKHWWGPTGFTNTIFQMDVKPQGVWEFIMHGPDGTDYKNKNIFFELIKPERIVFDHVSAPKHRSTITFTADGNKTLLTIHMLFESAEEKARVIKIFKADDGLKQNVDKLESYLAKMNTPFIIERTYKAPVEKVWEAISNRDAMKQWYFDLKEFKPEKGFKFQFAAGSADQSYTHLCEVTEVIPGKKLSYSWKYEGYEGNSVVTFELFKEGENTRLKLTHEGLETFPANNPDFAKKSFEKGWTHIIDKALKEFLEKSA